MLRIELIYRLTTVYGQDREQLRNYNHRELITLLERLRGGCNGGRKRKSKQRRLNKRQSFRN